MGLPQQVQRQAEAAEAYDKAMAEQDTAKEAEQTTEPSPLADDANKPEGVVAAEEPRKSEESPELWKQRFLSLQGMYNSQVPGLQQQVKQLSEQLTTMQTQRTTLEQNTPNQSGPATLVTQDDVTAFGQDLIDVARRIAREENALAAKAYVEQISSLKGELQAARQEVGAVAQNQVQTASDMFYVGLDKAIPRWRDIQATQECQEWLGTRIPGMQNDWNAALVSAAENSNLPAVLEVFGEFFARHPQFGQKPAPKATAPSNQAELARQVTPSKSRASVATPTGDKRMYTGAEYEQESLRIVRFSQQGKHDEAARLEAELNTALAEGRIR